MLMWQNLGNLPLFKGLNDLKKNVGHCGFPDGPSQWLKDSTLPMQGAQVSSSVEKVRSHISHDVARKKKVEAGHQRYDSQSCVFTNIKKVLGNFPAGPLVRTPCFHSRGPRFSPWSGNSDLTSHVAKEQNHQKKKSFKWLETKIYTMRKKDQGTGESESADILTGEMASTQKLLSPRVQTLDSQGHWVYFPMRTRFV